MKETRESQDGKRERAVRHFYRPWHYLQAVKQAGGLTSHATKLLPLEVRNAVEISARRYQSRSNVPSLAR